MHMVVIGRAIRRFSSISPPHPSQTPNVPLSIRLIASLTFARSFRSRSLIRRVKFRFDSRRARSVGSGKFSSGTAVMSETVLPAPASSSSNWRCSSSRHFSRTLRSISRPRRKAIQHYNLSSFRSVCKASLAGLTQGEPDRHLEPAGRGREGGGAGDPVSGGLVEGPRPAAPGHPDFLRNPPLSDADAEEDLPLLPATDRLFGIDDAGLDPLPEAADLRPVPPYAGPGASSPATCRPG